MTLHLLQIFFTDGRTFIMHPILQMRSGKLTLQNDHVHKIVKSILKETLHSYKLPPKIYSHRPQNTFLTSYNIP